ncbi:MAG: hypothetical protein U1E45_14795 [Geminicoccaceae bacterium]
MFGSVLICCLYAVSSPAGVQVLQIDDLASAPASGLSRNDVFLHSEVCVRVDGQQRSYRLRLEGDQGLGFVLTGDRAADRLPFAVTWDSRTGARESRDAPGDFGIFDVSDHRCRGDGSLAGVEVRIARHDLEAAKADHYRGRLLIEVSIP